MNIFVKDVMTVKVISVERDTPFAAIAAALREYRVSAFPVLDEAGQVIGVVSESDLLAKLALGGGGDGSPGMITGMLHQQQVEKARAVTAGDLMTSPAATVSPDDTVERAARLMYVRRVKRLPVVDAGGHLAGIVSRADVLAAFDRPDAEIRTEIREQIIRDAFLIDPGAFGVIVKDGVVTLAGRPEINDVGHQIVQRVRHVPGVVAVRDRLSYVHPEVPETHFNVPARFPAD